jgi:DNA-binding NtrC family response regulator/tetratricopeptide (TPR) repeat protein
MAAQNLGIVLTKTGRYREARAYLERSMKIATEIGDSIRALRAQLIAKVDRFEHKISEARSRLVSCFNRETRVLPEREHFLVLLEEALLDLDDGNIERVREAAADLRLRAEAMAPRGDLMAEVLLIEADIAAAESRWDDVERAATVAADIGRTDRDRPMEERAALRRALALAKSGKKEESDSVLRGLLDRHRSRGEWPAVAEVLQALARNRLETGEDPETALSLYREAAEVYRRIDVPRAEALVEAERVGGLITLGLRDEALTRIQGLRQIDDGTFPTLTAELDRLTGALRRKESEGLGGELDGLQVHERLEGILQAPGNAWDHLAEIISLLREALEVDGILFAKVKDRDFEILASTGIDSIRGKRVVPASALEPSDPTRVGSTLTVPLAARGASYVIHMQRLANKGQGPLGRSTRNYAMILAAEIARTLEIGTPDSEAGRLSKGISVADVVTQNGQMLKILDLIRRVSDTDLTVLLQGETGTGKKLLAHAIHRASERRTRQMVTVDCAALPDSLLEAELFGYRKGAFTGAAQDRSGLLAEASGGTVFLDEIDKAGLAVQRRFLHLLDSGEIRPVGATSYLKLDVRIVCATSSPDLRREVASGNFLKDLYYRLNDISIEVPPLRERRDDILLLAGCFVETYATQTGRRIRGISAAFRKALLAHDWPGNVRELEKAIRRAVTLADDDILLTPDLLPSDVLEANGDIVEEGDEKLKRKVDLFEKRAIEQALHACHGNKSQAAVMLGLSRKGLKGKMVRFRIGRRSPSSG